MKVLGIEPGAFRRLAVHLTTEPSLQTHFILFLKTLMCAFMCVLCVCGSVEMCMRVHLHVHACGGQKSILDNSVTVQLIF